MPFDWDIIDIKQHIKKNGWIRMWILQVSIPSCDRLDFSTEFICMNCAALVTEVTSHGLDDKGSVSNGSSDLSLCHCIQTSHGSRSSSYPMVRYPWIKLPDHESDYASLLDSEVMISWAVLSLLHASLCMVLIRHTYICSTRLFTELDFRYICKIVESNG